MPDDLCLICVESKAIRRHPLINPVNTYVSFSLLVVDDV